MKRMGNSRVLGVLIDIFMVMDICILGGKSRKKYSYGRVISGNLVAGISQSCRGVEEKMVFKVGWIGIAD